jgi:tetratricopeptide (TPR) repeat protein
MTFAKLSKTLTVALMIGLLAAASALAAPRGKKEAKPEPMFPNATRAEPKVKVAPALAKKLEQLVEFSQEDRPDDVIKLGDEIIANKRASAYEKSFALQAQAFAHVDKDDYAAAIPLLQKALDTNGLPNDTHYQILFQMAQMYLSEERYEESLTTLDKFLSETKSSKPEHLAMKGYALYRLERYDEAAKILEQAIAASDKPQASWSQLLMGSYFEQDKPLEAAKVAEGLLAKNPDDKSMLMNLASIYAQGDMYDQAAEVLERARAKGMLTDERDYRQLYAIYLNSEGKEAQGIAIINEGLEKGILKPSAELYIALGQAYYFSDKIAESIGAYRKALPFAKDGEPALNLARVLTNEEDYAGAKSAAQEALKKGVKKPGEAWIVVGRAEFGLGNRAGLIAAYKEAAKFPETAQQASEWLRKNAGGK